MKTSPDLFKILILMFCLVSGNSYAQETAQDAFKKGWDAITHERYDEAITEFNKAIELDPNMASAYDNLGNTYFFKSDFNNAILNLSKAIELMPGNSPTYLIRARAYFKIGDFDKSWADVIKARELGATDNALIEALKKYSGKDESNQPSPEHVLEEAKNSADREDYKNLPTEWQACKDDNDCSIGGLVCQYVPINKNYMKAPIRTIQDMFMDNACSNIRESGQKVSVGCIKNKCELH